MSDELDQRKRLTVRLAMLRHQLVHHAWLRRRRNGPAKTSIGGPPHSFSFLMLVLWTAVGFALAVSVIQLLLAMFAR